MAMDATDRHMARIYDRIDADTRVMLDCERCQLLRRVKELEAERDAFEKALKGKIQRWVEEEVVKRQRAERLLECRRELCATARRERDQARSALALIHAVPTYDAQTGAVVSVLVGGLRVGERGMLHVPERKGGAK